MKNIITSLLVVTGLLVTGNALAVDMPQLAKDNRCTACHAIDRKILGPAWMDVSKKYKGDKKAAAMLVAKVQKGGSGVWGPMAMPPQSAAKEADIKALVKFILGLAK
ncbi:MAG: c-type cytochrome [Sideroxydans sp.]|nr:c-type cytochrome [Sideroxydans sp.]